MHNNFFHIASWLHPIPPSHHPSSIIFHPLLSSSFLLHLISSQSVNQVAMWQRRDSMGILLATVDGDESRIARASGFFKGFTWYTHTADSYSYICSMHIYVVCIYM